MAKAARKRMEEDEHRYIAENGTKSNDVVLAARRFPHTPDNFRTAFHRDYTRILHSTAFRRLKSKTQVFLLAKSDHICTRMEHSLCVASIGRTVSKALGLNNELVAAIAIGHDLGHTPLGHHGETILKCFARKNRIPVAFTGHELHSLRVVDVLECPYSGHHQGLNLTFAVRDGIACHCGEQFEQELCPNRNKTEGELAQMSERGAMPATLEGCLVRMVDKIS